MTPLVSPITTRASRWPGVEQHRTNEEVIFLSDGREIGRLTAPGSLVVPTTRALRNQLLTDGFADPLPGQSEGVVYRVRSPADIAGAIRLLRLAYVANRGELTSPDTALVELEELGVSNELVAVVLDETVRHSV